MMLQIGTLYGMRVPFGYIFVKKPHLVTAKVNLSGLISLPTPRGMAQKSSWVRRLTLSTP